MKSPTLDTTSAPEEGNQKSENAAKPEKATTPVQKKLKVAYFHEPEIATFNISASNPTRPFRACLAHRLIGAFKLFPKLIDLNKVRLATVTDLTQYHSDNYIQMLQIVDEHLQSVLRTTVSAETITYIENIMRKYNLSLSETNANQAFLGILDYCRLYSTGSLASAACLNSRAADVAINWSGGMSRPRVESAAMGGFVNDSVLALLELLKCHEKVAYISLDYWHPAGVEEAFYGTPRVMTVSFHGSQHVPGHRAPNTAGYRSWAGASSHRSGSAEADTGVNAGSGFAVNLPLGEGLTDDTLLQVFTAVTRKVNSVFRPSAVVLQCGTSGLAADRLGSWSLSPRGIGECAREVASWGVPLLLLGGQGTDLADAARTWAWVTALVVGEDEQLADATIPAHESQAYYGPDLSLHRKRSVSRAGAPGPALGAAERAVRRLEALGQAVEAEQAHLASLQQQAIAQQQRMAQAAFTGYQ